MPACAAVVTISVRGVPARAGAGVGADRGRRMRRESKTWTGTRQRRDVFQRSALLVANSSKISFKSDSRGLISTADCMGRKQLWLPIDKREF